MSKNKIAFILFTLLSVVYSITRGLKQGPGGDFHAFWYAGSNFFSSKPIYGIFPGVREFIYPPFAALFFSFFGVIPLKISAIIFSILNGLIYPASIFLTRKIFIDNLPNIEKKAIDISIYLATITSFKFFLNNLSIVQVNNIVFFLCLAGIHYFFKKNIKLSVFFFTLSTFLKLTPALFILFLLIFSFKKVSKILIPQILFFTITPHLFRFNRIKMDLQEYYDNFLAPILQSGTSRGGSYANQSLGGVLERTLTGDFSKVDTYGFKIPTIANLDPSVVKLIFISSALILLISLVWMIARNQKKIDHLASVQSFSGIFLISHILSPVTWKHHLVSLLFVNMTFFVPFFANDLMKIYRRHVDKVLFALIVITSLLGKSIIGMKYQRILGGYGVYTYTMIAIFFYLLSKKSRSLRP